MYLRDDSEVPRHCVTRWPLAQEQQNSLRMTRPLASPQRFPFGVSGSREKSLCVAPPSSLFKVGPRPEGRIFLGDPASYQLLAQVCKIALRAVRGTLVTGGSFILPSLYFSRKESASLTQLQVRVGPAVLFQGPKFHIFQKLKD